MHSNAESRKSYTTVPVPPAPRTGDVLSPLEEPTCPSDVATNAAHPVHVDLSGIRVLSACVHGQTHAAALP